MSLESPIASRPASPEPLGAPEKPRPRNLSFISAGAAKLLITLLWIVGAVLAFHAAYLSSFTAFLVVVYVFALLQLARADTWRGAFYPGLITGLLVAAAGLSFFWTLFSAAAVALWVVYAIWIGIFVALARLAFRFKNGTALLLIPFLWCGLEYFRSELYYLRFSWLTPGFAFAGAPWAMPFRFFGAYGIGFLVALMACGAAILWPRSIVRSLLLLGVGIAVIRLSTALLPNHEPAARPQLAAIHIAGIQMEFPTENEVLVRLNALVRKEPGLDLIVLSEYTFSEPVPARVLSWCRSNHMYLIVGAKEAAPAADFYNTACVVSPAGQIVFRQVKSVPIQFFKDGLPAPEQRLWKSPWGNLGLCVCYDLSYSRVTDRLVERGAQALIVPTMDVADWGERQHRLHARVAPVRACEYGIPIFRLASSGISQSVDSAGRLRASAPFPGEGATIIDTLFLSTPGSLPVDRWLAPASTGVTAGFIIFALARFLWKRRSAASAQAPFSDPISCKSTMTASLNSPPATP